MAILVYPSNMFRRISKLIQQGNKEENVQEDARTFLNMQRL